MTLPSTPPFLEDFPQKIQLHHHVWSATPAMFDDSRGKKNLPNMTSSAAWRTCCKRRNRSSTCRNVRPLEGHCLMKYWFTLFACMCIYIYCIVYIHFYSRNLIICHKYITYPALSDDSSFSMVETSEINLDPSGIIACLSACMHPSWQQYVLVHIYIYIDIFNIRVRCVYIYML